MIEQELIDGFKKVINSSLVIFGVKDTYTRLGAGSAREFAQYRLSNVLKALYNADVTYNDLLYASNILHKLDFAPRIIDIIKLCKYKFQENEYLAYFKQMVDESYFRKLNPNSPKIKTHCQKLYNVNVQISKEGIDILHSTYEACKEIFIRIFNKVFTSNNLLPIPEPMLALDNASIDVIQSRKFLSKMREIINSDAHFSNDEIKNLCSKIKNNL